VIVAVVGSRDFPRLTAVDELVNGLWFAHVNLKIISGGARGVDSRVRVACKEHLRPSGDPDPIPFEEFPADWTRLGRPAGHARNQKLVEMSDLVIAFWDGESKGTKDTIDLALKLRKQLEVHFP
jgi:hypothetical protein